MNNSSRQPVLPLHEIRFIFPAQLEFLLKFFSQHELLSSSHFIYSLLNLLFYQEHASSLVPIFLFEANFILLKRFLILFSSSIFWAQNPIQPISHLSGQQCICTNLSLTVSILLSCSEICPDSVLFHFQLFMRFHVQLSYFDSSSFQNTASCYIL